MSEPRHYCTYCKKKRNESKMILFKYPLLLKTAWHCKECYQRYENLLASQKEALKMLSSGVKKKKKTPQKLNKNKKELFEEAALKKGYSLNKDGGKYADAWLEEAWQVHQLVVECAGATR